MLLQNSLGDTLLVRIHEFTEICDDLGEFEQQSKIRTVTLSRAKRGTRFVFVGDFIAWKKPKGDRILFNRPDMIDKKPQAIKLKRLLEST